MNCPRCNAFVQPGASSCGNCGLLFPGAAPQPQQTYYAPHAVQAPQAESNKEKLYRKILVAFALLLVVESLFWTLTSKLQYEWGWNIGWITSIVNLLTGIAFAGFPLVVGLVLPKTNGLRILLIILGSIWFLYRVSTLIYDRFFYSPEPFTYFQF
ncbi:MAG TPA: zinc ribbon domain-containing protein [Bacteroidia bacterium]|nr:zinc ribbon domain-containing protein [Bacteroidia bacterium]